MTARPLVLSTSLLLCALAGCSSGPSDGDMKAAMQTSMASALQGTPAVLGDMVKIEVLSVQKIGCEQSGEAYTCDVMVEVKSPLVGVQKNATKARFAKVSGAWVFVQ